MSHRPPTRYPSLVVAAMILALAGLTACGGGGGGEASPTAAALSVADVEFQSLKLLNAARGGGLPPLMSDPGAALAARAHSEAMRDGGFFGHADPATGAGLRQRLRAAGVSFSAAAENVVRVEHRGNPAGVAQSELMASGGHRENILDPRFERVGVGIARSGNVYWVTQIFIRP